MPLNTHIKRLNKLKDYDSADFLCANKQYIFRKFQGMQTKLQILLTKWMKNGFMQFICSFTGELAK